MKREYTFLVTRNKRKEEKQTNKKKLNGLFCLGHPQRLTCWGLGLNR